MGNRHPFAVHFDFVVVANHATLGRATIHQVAAQTAVISSEFQVEVLMPFLVTRSIMSLLRRCAYIQKRGGRAAEQQHELALGDHSITSSARASSVAGTSRPSVLAVLRLTTSSYLTG